jgi:hypothetical protein
VTKVCTTCQTDKPLEEFSPSPKGRLGRQSRCKACTNIYLAERLANMPAEQKADVYARARRSRVARKYGPEALLVLDRIDAGEPCENCGKRTTKMPIDHNHETGATRGLLCSNCNTALGLLDENPETIMGLLAYLLQHSPELAVT